MVVIIGLNPDPNGYRHDFVIHDFSNAQAFAISLSQYHNLHYGKKTPFYIYTYTYQGYVNITQGSYLYTLEQLYDKRLAKLVNYGYNIELTQSSADKNYLICDHYQTNQDRNDITSDCFQHFTSKTQLRIVHHQIIGQIKQGYYNGLVYEIITATNPEK